MAENVPKLSRQVPELFASQDETYLPMELPICNENAKLGVAWVDKLMKILN